jgi:hypothetical protein
MIKPDDNTIDQHQMSTQMTIIMTMPTPVMRTPHDNPDCNILVNDKLDDNIDDNTDNNRLQQIQSR